MILEDRYGVQKCKIDPDNALISVSDSYKLYQAFSLDGAQIYILRIPTSLSGNTDINREAEILLHLQKSADQLEQKYAEVKHDSTARIHYDWLFPQLVDSFITDEYQGHRQVNLLSIVDGVVPDYVPLVKLVDKYKVDSKTAAWILGRFLKLQAFLDDVGVFFKFQPDQVIIDPRMHRIVYLGWPQCSESASYDSIKHIARYILDWLEDDGTEHEDDFRNFLTYLIDYPDTVHMEGFEAHKILYTNLEKWWGHHYHPFTYFDIETGNWHQITDAPNF